MVYTLNKSVIDVTSTFLKKTGSPGKINHWVSDSIVVIKVGATISEDDKTWKKNTTKVGVTIYYIPSCIFRTT